ncbi:RNA chaperone Hfq [Trinickia violacea]|uniref:RNA-binding protein Hfq n=1 Tax=Trinickia violacea TaxID=2571746 RepID=A0A4P8IRX7_9BURK|nr:RNA chaperone Hfq [Trinickia violacea]QCP49953.1 RNA chaperone Hfq [Trinickia violacea]
MPNPAESHPQNDFMNAARKERKRVEIYLVNGIRLTGCIESFDQYLVMLRTPVGLQGIYKRAISTIQLDTGTRPGPRGPRTGGSGHGERHTSRDSFGPRESRDSRESRESRDTHGLAPADSSAPVERSPDAPASGSAPVVVTRRRRPYGSAPGGNESGE